MFYGSSSLRVLTDISKMDISNINNISFLFQICSYFKVMPDISKCNIIDLKDITGLFYGYSST